ncbi:putative zinc finger motif, C2HC5-type-domain-containing protein [Absidia repens]|uniref:Putative zinc finger motif, C2HC5-type-domain-containing protein n=1 Tax=Absidia repens TaxID=90262 RepID=A0A1X2ID86_9FUNG|nr:putative zinc finger motif, C2HC5-type-domain-containing protein [Absidia repens]
MDNWVIDQLGVFLGFDPETLQTQVLPYLSSFDSPTALSEHLQDMLGTSDDTLNFIHTYVQHRFPSKPPAQQQQKQQKQQKQQQSVNTTSSSSTTNKKDASQFPSLPPNANGPTTSWPGNMTVYMKESDRGTGKSTKNKKASTKPQNNTSNGNSSGSLVSDRLEKKKNKNSNTNNMTLESALKELDINVHQGKKRQICNCQATKHDLLVIAPNCLNCGKIICVVEGIGPCSFCGTPVLSKEQQISLIADAKKKRSEAKQLQHQQLQQERKAAKATTQSIGYASKVSGDVVSKYVFDQQVEDEQRQRAEQHKEKLLEFQRTSAQRSTVIDQATDFTLPTDQSNPWMTAQEKAMQLKKQQANMRRLDGGRSSQRRVLTIDIGSKQARVDNVMEDLTSSDEDEPAEPDQLVAPSHDSSSSGTFAKNPLLKGLQGPTFRGLGKQKIKQNHQGHQERKSRIQFDADGASTGAGAGAGAGDQIDNDMVPVVE